MRKGRTEGVARSAPDGLGSDHFAASTTRCEISSTPTTAVQTLLDGAFNACNLGRGSPQQTQQQWQNNGGTPSSPPPPPVPHRNSYASPRLLLIAAPPHQHLALHHTHNTPLISLPCHHHLLLRFFSPPPTPPSFSSTSHPGQDPYANFGGVPWTESYPLTRRQRAPLQRPFGQRVPPQPQGALPPPWGRVCYNHDWRP